MRLFDIFKTDSLEVIRKKFRDIKIAYSALEKYIDSIIILVKDEEKKLESAYLLFSKDSPATHYQELMAESGLAIAKIDVEAIKNLTVLKLDSKKVGNKLQYVHDNIRDQKKVIEKLVKKGNRLKRKSRDPKKASFQQKIIEKLTVLQQDYLSLLHILDKIIPLTEQFSQYISDASDAMRDKKYAEVKVILEKTEALHLQLENKMITEEVSLPRLQGLVEQHIEDISVLLQFSKKNLVKA